jgi:hypothetical protein
LLLYWTISNCCGNFCGKRNFNVSLELESLLVHIVDKFYKQDKPKIEFLFWFRKFEGFEDFKGNISDDRVNNVNE